MRNTKTLLAMVNSHIEMSERVLHTPYVKDILPKVDTIVQKDMLSGEWLVKKRERSDTKSGTFSA